jgi:hypothetical protein
MTIAPDIRREQLPPRALAVETGRPRVVVLISQHGFVNGLMVVRRGRQWECCRQARGPRWRGGGVADSGNTY